MIVGERRFGLQFPGGCRSWLYRALIVGKNEAVKALAFNKSQQLSISGSQQVQYQYLRTTNFSRLQ
jgi:hypothetical protein